MRRARLNQRIKRRRRLSPRHETRNWYALQVKRIQAKTRFKTRRISNHATLVSKHYVGGKEDVIHQWQLRSRRGTLTVSYAAYGWVGTPFFRLVDRKLTLGKFRIDVD